MAYNHKCLGDMFDEVVRQNKQSLWHQHDERSMVFSVSIRKKTFYKAGTLFKKLQSRTNY